MRGNMPSQPTHSLSTISIRLLLRGTHIGYIVVALHVLRMDRYKLSLVSYSVAMTRSGETKQ